MATLATQKIARSGLAPAYAAATGGGDKLTPGQNTYLHVKNGGGASITVTLETPASVGQNLVTTPLAVVVPNAGERLIGPLPGSIFADPTDGLTDVTYSAVTSVTVGVFDCSA